MLVIEPATSERIFTPSSTGLPELVAAGDALVGQIEHGQAPGTGVLVGSGVGVDVDVLVGVGVDVGVLVAAPMVGVLVDVGVLLGVGVLLAVGVLVAVGVTVGVLVAVGVAVAVPTAAPSSTSRLSKLVSQPLLLPMVMLVQVVVQLVVSVWTELAGTLSVAVGWPEHAAVTVLATDPPLNTSIWMSRLGVTKVIGALVGPTPLNAMLFVVNRLHGPDRYHRLVPQLATPFGYWPFRARFTGVSVLKSMSTAPTTGVGVAVGVPGVGEAVEVGVGVGVEPGGGGTP
jgi:hypothetical protein